MKKKFMNGRDMSGNLVEFAVEGGRFVDGEGPETVDLQKRTVLPGFVDSHCHIIPMGLDLQKLNLSGLGSREQVLDAVLEWHSRTDSSTWLLAVHYDQTRFSDGAHLTCHDLDRIVPERLPHRRPLGTVSRVRDFKGARADSRRDDGRRHAGRTPDGAVRDHLGYRYDDGPMEPGARVAGLPQGFPRWLPRAAPALDAMGNRPRA